MVNEHLVEIDNGIVGIINEPKNALDVPAGLLLHGFGSQKNEVGDMYKRLAISLATKNIASFRFDFRGCGESAGDMSDTTIDQLVNDIKTAYDYLSRMSFINSTCIGIVGFSLGGAISIISAAQNPKWYKSLVTWSSMLNLKTDFLSSLGRENFDKATEEGVVTINLGWRTVRLKKHFFHSLGKYDLQELINLYKGAFMSIAGSEDASTPYVNAFAELTKATPKKVLIINGADHIFNALSSDLSTSNIVIDKTTSWLKKTL